ncbi:ABC transporter ATP-binding protein [Albimonas pacifica]|uniref:Amino acid/amide ABC transporter ATP-binding protein 2, HAAT family n=1 Tax=Albimonas pacifica TaxID=1114924 RepID=A0A1I3BNH1_9RHOB|nr:ABC transporter ATP-binding protein [Albimonas pacifica]SFH63636.1 amino acid/amide ABC transporter ATP-binding protein 2, HAAT family [Albimonas pacifica]
MPDPTGAAVALALKDVRAGYGGPDVLKGVSLEVPRGCIVTVVGPNGHGKSTLLRTVSGLTRLRGGRILALGAEIQDHAAHRRAAAGIAHVPQGDLLFPDMTVLENLRMGAYLERDAAQEKRRLDEVFALLPRLAERRTQVAASLSGGERRMVGIGRGLMAGGQVLMLDEPSLGLAPLVIEQIYEVIARLREQGRTILLVEENPARVAELSDVMHLFDDGEIVWSGAPDDLMNREELLATYLGG